LPLEEATRSGSATVISGSTSRPGYAIRVIPLRYIPAGELKSVLDPFVPPGGTLQVDGTRNVMVVSGPASDLEGFAALVRQFDTDWLSGTSFALYPLRVGLVRDVAAELQAILLQSAEGTGPAAAPSATPTPAAAPGQPSAPLVAPGTGPLAGLVRVLPIERLNAILVIASQPSYLRQVKQWIDRLDYGDDQTTPRMFEYYVQNSRAIDMAAVLTELLSAGDVRAVIPQPGGGFGGPDMTIPVRSTGMGMNTGMGFGAGGASVMANPPPMSSGGMGLSGGSTAGGTSGTFGQAQGYGFGSRRARQLSQARSPGAASGREEDELQLPPIRVVADEKNNALVILARPRDYRMVEALIRKLDVVPLQVLIEATIAEVTLNDTLQYGVQFFLKQGGSRFSLTTATTGSIAPGDLSGVFPGFNYVLTGTDSQVILSALSSVSNVNVISSPQILVLDHQTAALQVGDQVPIVVQSSQSVLNPDAPVVNSVQYRNTGVVLQVTPSVNSSGLVTLNIDQEVSDVVRTTTSTINSPTIAQRRIISSVIAQDGETVALGGLIRENQSDVRSGIPFLSELPIIGPLFRNTSRGTGRTELLVLLSPRIVRDPKQARDLTDELRTRMRALRPLDVRVR
jgi:general secretion pathway protein D